MFWRKKRVIKYEDFISPDEIFIDSKNIPGFSREQFEGRIERPIGKKTLWGISIFFLLIGSLLFIRIVVLQVVHGQALRARAENNRLDSVQIPFQRGIIYDRYKKELAWNTPDGRTYIDLPGLSHVLGYVSSPPQEITIGREGVEKQYENILSGEPGLKLIEVDSKNQIKSESVQKLPIPGKSIILTIDAELQSALYNAINTVVEERGFQGGAGIIMNPKTGEILALTNWPEYDANMLSRGEPFQEIQNFLQDERKPFLNRAVSGLYAPGSVIKPLIALAALNEKIVSPETQIFSGGSISVPNPFFPDKPTVFYDWKPHGWVDMRRAIAVSSDIYFYTIGGGYGDIRGLGISKIQKYAKMFGFGSKTHIDIPAEQEGLVPGPEWKKSNFPEDPLWRIGDTYHISIGQGNFQVTPIQVAVFTAAIANNGKLIQPRLLQSENGGVDVNYRMIDNIPVEYFQVVQEGMEQAVQFGTASALSDLGINMAGKTGTAEIGFKKKLVNSWFSGFAPAEDPKFVITIVLERGPASNLVGAVAVARQVLQWTLIHRPEYITN